MRRDEVVGELAEVTLGVVFLRRGFLEWRALRVNAIEQLVLSLVQLPVFLIVLFCKIFLDSLSCFQRTVVIFLDMLSCFRRSVVAVLLLSSFLCLSGMETFENETNAANYALDSAFEDFVRQSRVWTFGGKI